MKSILAGIGFLMMIIPGALGQERDNISDPDQLVVSPWSAGADSIAELGDLKRFDIGMNVGTGFTYSPKNFFGPSYYIAPDFSYLVTPRFVLSAGVGVEYARFYPLYSGSSDQDEILPMTRVFLYAHGTYLLSSRLTVSGIAYKGINDVPRLTNYSPSYNTTYQGMGVGFNYKFTNSFSVGFEMRIQQNSYFPNDRFIPPDGYIPIPGF